MAGTVIFPTEYVEITGPLVFLAGPIQGAKPWQTEAIQHLKNLVPTLHIACPRRDNIPEQFVYAEQVNWETYYLNRAAKNGVILFWLAKESEHFCERAYAQTSRFELAEWKVKHERDQIKLAIGIEAGFTGEAYIRLRFSQDCPTLTIYSSLSETCQAVIQQIDA